MKQFISWPLLVGALVAGCGDKPAPRAAFVFNRPEHLELVCLNPAGDDDPFTDKQPKVLPLRCCSAQTPLAPKAFFASDKERRQSCGDIDAPILHALVTQSARGEVAAVDLENGTVKDANRRIPGATFVDVGGLPTAIITPREIETTAGTTIGSPWTFIASGEDYNVRAIATCRFVGSDGVACGPERLGGDDDLEMIDEDERRAILEVPMPSAPADMVYLDGSLWVTLPDLSAIARIELAPQGEDENGHPFVEEDGRTALPTVYAIPSVADLDPGPPILEDEPYRAVCGLEYKSSPNPLQIPAEPWAMSAEAPAPKRLRVDETSGLLLVGDRGQPVVHALAVVDGVPYPRGALKTGAPVRDFAVTPPVPRTAPAFEELTPEKPNPTFANDDLMLSKGLPEFSLDSARYVYAIDDRDGSVLALTFEVDAQSGAVSGSLLEAPHRFAQGASDRIHINGNATALDIIDTRKLTGDHICNAADAKGLDKLIKQVEKEQDAASGADAAQAGKKLQKLEAARTLAAEVGSTSLHGVFVAVVDSLGALSIVDVHDADMFCRAGAWCTGNGAGEATRSKSSAPAPLAVQRHAVRRGAIGEVEVAASNENALSELECPEGMFPALKDSGEDEPVLVCSSADPWTSFTTSFEVEYEGELGRTVGSFLEKDEQGRLVLRAAPGLDFCARGIVPDVLDGEDDGYLGDWVVATAIPSQQLKGCSAPTAGREPRMRVLEAFSDRLILEDPVLPSGTSGGAKKPYDADKLLECFPTSMPAAWRVNDRYLVRWVGNAHLHRMVASESDGACVEDETKDERLRSRTQPGELFQNPYVAFRLSELDEDSLPSALDTVIQVSGGASGLVLVASSGAESLPVVVRYLDVTGELFVVDTTSQGLRRFGLSPLGSDGKSYR